MHFTPFVQNISVVLPAALGLTVAAFIIATAFYCTRRLRQRNEKKSHEQVVYQPRKRPTAVRSPSGQPGHGTHYLKKSPSPTTLAKPLPGSSMSPTSESAHHTTKITATPSVKTQSIPITTHTTYTEENETQSKSAELRCSPADVTNGHDVADTVDYGKLGSLVFKLRYLVDRNALVVSVIRCRALPYKMIADELSNGVNGKAQTATDPYVKLQLLPDKQHKVKTR